MAFSSSTPSAMGRWNALRPLMRPVPPARLLMTAVRTAWARSSPPDDAPPELMIRLLLFDDVGLDGHAEVVRLAREVRRNLVVDAVYLEIAAPRVAPQDGEHPELVSPGKRLGDLDDLAVRFGGAEVDGGPHAGCPQIVRLLDRAEHDLVVGRRVGQQLVVVDLHDERDPVSESSRHHGKNPEGRGDPVAATRDGEFNDLRRVEIGRVGGKRRGSRVLDALVDRQDRDIARPAHSAVIEKALQIPQDLRRAIGLSHDPAHEVRPGQVQVVLGDS